jgi:hypothetical protein
VVNGLDASTKLSGAVADCWNYIQKTYFPDTVLLRCYANGHTYGVEGYPHTDSNRPQDRTLVVYLNKQWQRGWGGETVIYNGQRIVHAELPSYNRALNFSGFNWHAARGVTRICNDLRITLMFKFAPANTDSVRDRIQQFLDSIGTNTKSHSGSTLFVHLLSTYDLLKLAGQDETTCLAGAIHSIFGTNVFTEKTLSLEVEDRKRVIAEVGERAIELATIFSRINRPAILEEYLANGTSTGFDDATSRILCAIEGANLQDQNALKSYPKLTEFWKNIYINNR